MVLNVEEIVTCEHMLNILDNDINQSYFIDGLKHQIKVRRKYLTNIAD